MGRGSSGSAGSKGVGGGAAITSANIEGKLQDIKDSDKSLDDALEVTSKVKDVLDDAEVGTTFVLKGSDSWYHQYEKSDDNGKWNVTIGRNRAELQTNKASKDSVNTTAGDVVNCLYKLD